MLKPVTVFEHLAPPPDPVPRQVEIRPNVHIGMSFSGATRPDARRATEEELRWAVEGFRRVVVRGPYGFIRALHVDIHGGFAEVSAEVVLPDRDTGRPVEFRFVCGGTPLEYVAEVSPAHVIRTALRELVLHELDEAIHVGGVRVFDPHAREGMGMALPISPPFPPDPRGLR